MVNESIKNLEHKNYLENFVHLHKYLHIYLNMDWNVCFCPDFGLYYDNKLEIENDKDMPQDVNELMG